MTNTSDSPQRTYENVMETLVMKEINFQLNQLPRKVANLVDPVDAATYALNRLPPLYAASQRGREQQEKQAKLKYNDQIKTTVRQAIAAVQLDPLRISVPLMVVFDGDYQKAMKSLQELEEWLKKHKLLSVRQITWDNLLKSVKGAFFRASRMGIEGYLRDDVKSQFEEWDH